MDSRRHTLLVVDDEVDVLESLRHLFHRSYRVLTASSGQEAISMLERHDAGISLVVLDLTMPGMDGAATFRAIRKLRTDLPVVLSSGYDEADVERRLEGERFAAFLKKPYSVSALAKKVSQVALHASA